MKVVKRDDAVINYTVNGKGDITLLFIHGSYINQTYWSEQVFHFQKRFKVVTMDLPGHGKSGRERAEWSVTGFAKDVAIIIKELNLKNVVLVGHSLGADIALITATAFPDNIIGLVAVDYFKMAGTPLPPEFEKEAQQIREDLNKDFAGTNEQYARKGLLTKNTPPTVTERVIDDYRNAFEPMGKSITPEVFKMYETQQRRMPQLKFKLYLINVNYIPTDKDALKKYAGHGFELFELNGSSHYPMIEIPDAFNNSLENILGKISSEHRAINEVMTKY